MSRVSGTRGRRKDSEARLQTATQTWRERLKLAASLKPCRWQQQGKETKAKSEKKSHRADGSDSSDRVCNNKETSLETSAPFYLASRHFLKSASLSLANDWISFYANVIKRQKRTSKQGLSFTL